MSLFGKKKPQEKTVLILDIESGSVGAALVRVAGDERPKLFGETRSLLPVSLSRTGEQLAAGVEHALEEVLHKVSELAARFRNASASQARPLGDVEKVAVFFAPPWGRPNLAAGKPEFMPQMSGFVRAAAERSFGQLPLSLYTSAGVAAASARSLEPGPALLYIVGGEVSEVLRLSERGVQAHSTIPLGSHTLLRTLQSHGGLSELEARSAARLPFGTAHLREPFSATAALVGDHFVDAARDLLEPGTLGRVRVVGEQAAAEWFAQALASHEPLTELFPNGGEVRALRLQHIGPHIAAHAATPDLPLMLQALYVRSL